MIKKYWKSITCTTIILVLSFLPSKSFKSIKVPEFSDLVVHFIMYFVFAGIVYYERKKQKEIFKKIIFYVLIVGFCLSAVTELGQEFLIPSRDGNIYDFCANLSGIIILLIIVLLSKRKED